MKPLPISVPVYEFENKIDGLKSTNYYLGGFSVVLWDTDAEKAVPVATVFSTLDGAIAYAKKIVGI